MHKLREALAAETKDTKLHGIVEVDGGYFGGHIRPANLAKDRVDRRLARHQTGKRRVVVVMRQRGGRTLTTVCRYEHQGIEVIKERVSSAAQIHADEASHWDALHGHKAYQPPGGLQSAWSLHKLGGVLLCPDEVDGARAAPSCKPSQATRLRSSCSVVGGSPANGQRISDQAHSRTCCGAPSVSTVEGLLATLGIVKSGRRWRLRVIRGRIAAVSSTRRVSMAEARPRSRSGTHVRAALNIGSPSLTVTRLLVGQERTWSVSLRSSALGQERTCSLALHVRPT